MGDLRPIETVQVTDSILLSSPIGHRSKVTNLDARVSICAVNLRKLLIRSSKIFRQMDLYKESRAPSGVMSFDR